MISSNNPFGIVVAATQKRGIGKNGMERYK